MIASNLESRPSPDFVLRLQHLIIAAHSTHPAIPCRMNEIRIQEHPSPIKNWKQLLVVAVLAFAVPVLLIIAIVQILTGGLKVDPRSLAMSEEVIAARLKPVGEVRLTPEAPSLPPSAAAASTQPVAAAPARSGEQVYQQACAMCHAAGLAGAPKTGDKTAWQARVAQGLPTLYNHAINGIRAMPAKGGNPGLADAEVKAAVDYLAAQAK